MENQEKLQKLLSEFAQGKLESSQVEDFLKDIKCPHCGKQIIGDKNAKQK